jgi:hypothetical protein
MMIKLTNYEQNVNLLRNVWVKEEVGLNKLLGSPIIILNYIFNWCSSDSPPECVSKDNQLYFYFAQRKIADDTMLSENMVRDALDKLTKLEYITKYYDMRSRKLYLSFNFNEIVKLLFKNSYSEKIFNFIRECEEVVKNMTCGFFEEERKVKYSEESENLTIRMLNYAGELFKNRVPKDLTKPTKTFEKSCRILDDVYKGKFSNYKLYNISRHENQFRININDKLQEIDNLKGNWEEIEKTLKLAIDNFRLMKDKHRLPLKKSYLESSFEKWLFNDYSYIGGEGSSQFLFSLKEPSYLGEEFSERKADKYFNMLNYRAKENGNELFKLAPDNINDGFYWENIYKIDCWARNLLTHENNAKYWLQYPSDIILQFKEYLDEKNVQVTNSIFDFEKALLSNTPFKWFLTLKFKQYGLDFKFLDCKTDEDFEKVNKKKFAF